MFDLERSIADWRRSLARNGLQNSDIASELEAHLRDAIDAQVVAGTEPQKAFETALARLGSTADLECEFQCAGISLKEPMHMKKALLVLAGIPAAPIDAESSSSSTEPAWATYIKSAFFATPALLLWIFSVLFLIPKLNFLCNRAGKELPSAIHNANMLSEHATMLCVAFITALLLLEFKTQFWARYRRAILGFWVFAVNTAVLVLTGILMVMSLLLAL